MIKIEANKNGKQVKTTTKKVVKKTKSTTKSTRNSKNKNGVKGKKIIKIRKVKTIIVVGPDGKKTVKIIDEDKERHKLLLEKIKILE